MNAQPLDLDRLSWREINAYADQLALAYGRRPSKEKLDRLHDLKNLATRKSIETYRNQMLCRNEV